MNLRPKEKARLLISNFFLVFAGLLFISTLCAQSGMRTVSLQKGVQNLALENGWIQIGVHLEEALPKSTEIYLHYGGNVIQDRDFEAPNKIVIPAGNLTQNIRIANINTQFLTEESFLTVLVSPQQKGVKSNGSLLLFKLNANGMIREEVITP